MAKRKQRSSSDVTVTPHHVYLTTGAHHSTRHTPRIIPQLLTLKLVIFLFYGGMASIYPFFTLHMKSIGITIVETGVISFLLPILSCVFVPFTGTLADKVGSIRWIIGGLTIVHVLFHLLLVGVPQLRDTTLSTPTTVKSLVMEFHCHNRQNGLIYLPRDALPDCSDGQLTVPDKFDNELQIDECWSDCVGWRHNNGGPSVCFYSEGKGRYCTKWPDLELQIFRDIVLTKSLAGTRNASSKWETVQFRNDEGLLLQSAQCVNGHMKRHRESPECSVVCEASATHPLQCEQALQDKNHRLTVVIYFLLRLLGLVGLSSVFILTDTITLQMIQKYAGATFGTHRIFAALAFAVIPPLAGYLIDVTAQTRGRDNPWSFLPGFILFAALSLLGALVVLFTAVPSSAPKKDVWRNVGKVLGNVTVIGIILVMMVAGMSDGYTISFLYWFLESELDAPKWLLGIGAAMSNGFSLPLFATAHLIIPRVGHSNLMIFCLFLNSLRYFCYSFLPAAFWFLFVEILTAMTTATLYTVPVLYAQSIAPNYVSSVQALLIAATFGLGRGLGSLTGGYTIAAVGHRTSFRIFALIFFLVAVIYATIRWWFFRKSNDQSTLPKMTIETQDDYQSGNNFMSDNLSAMFAMYEEENPPLAEQGPEMEALLESDEFLYVNRPGFASSV